MENISKTLESKVESKHPIVLLDAGYVNFYSNIRSIRYTAISKCVIFLPIFIGIFFK